MRTTIFVSAVLAALNFSIQADAILLSQDQPPTTSYLELAQTEAEVASLTDAAQLTGEAKELVDTITDGDFAVLDFLQNGKKIVSTSLGRQIKFKLTELIGAPKSNEKKITNWVLFTTNLEQLVHGYKAEKVRGVTGKDAVYDTKLKNALRRLIVTLDDDMGNYAF